MNEEVKMRLCHAFLDWKTDRTAVISVNHERERRIRLALLAARMNGFLRYGEE
jgi:RNase P/RNase MRP subunit POP5